VPIDIGYFRKPTGNTVPYPPLVDEIRNNRGFTDLRGKPELVSRIAEAQESAALAGILKAIAHPSSPFLSLGCDLGQSREKNKSRGKALCFAGGYLQIADIRLGAFEYEELEKLETLAKACDVDLHACVGKDDWEIEFNLSIVAYKFDDYIESQSLWIWFNAAANNFTAAIASRERLISTIGRVINENLQ
jgi:hypothetical protein